MNVRSTRSSAWQRTAAFTLTELLVAIALLVILVVALSQFVTHGATIVRSRSKQLDTDAHGRAVLDRIGADINSMLKRTDIDYYLKQPAKSYTPGNSSGHTQGKKAASATVLNDQIAFFAEVPASSPSALQSPISLVAYRVNAGSSDPKYLKLERMAKGLAWNGASTASLNANDSKSRDIAYPIVFSPGQIAAGTGAWAQPWGPWAAAITNFAKTAPPTAPEVSQDTDYELLSRQVFRFEYYYLLKDGTVTDTPWSTDRVPTQNSLTDPRSIGLVDIEAICVSIAALDSASRSLISTSTIFDIASDLTDFKDAPGSGFNGKLKSTDVDAQWNKAIRTIITSKFTTAGSAVPPAVASAIRVYSRQFELGGL